MEGSGIFNHRLGDVRGLQGAGIFNRANNVEGMQGAGILRVHDVAETVQALKVWRALED